MIEITEELDRVAESYERDGMRYTASVLKRARKKITLSLSEADIALIDEIGKLTGAYTASEVVRDALRQAVKSARGQKHE